MRILSLLFFVGIISVGYGQETFPPNIDEQADYVGGQDAMILFMADNIVYPEQAKTDQIEGVVYVSFNIETDGKITDVKLVKGVHDLLDNEAIRVIEAMPNWTPAKSNGNPIKTQMTLPVKFQLNNK